MKYYSLVSTHLSRFVFFGILFVCNQVQAQDNDTKPLFFKAKYPGGTTKDVVLLDDPVNMPRFNVAVNTIAIMDLGGSPIYPLGGTLRVRLNKRFNLEVNSFQSPVKPKMQNYIEFYKPRDFLVKPSYRRDVTIQFKAIQKIVKKEGEVIIDYIYGYNERTDVSAILPRRFKKSLDLNVGFAKDRIDFIRVYGDNGEFVNAKVNMLKAGISYTKDQCYVVLTDETKRSYFRRWRFYYDMYWGKMKTGPLLNEQAQSMDSLLLPQTKNLGMKFGYEIIFGINNTGGILGMKLEFGPRPGLKPGILSNGNSFEYKSSYWQWGFFFGWGARPKVQKNFDEYMKMK
ncbi:MAG: hypothetical protein KG003_13685 [Bacteroidetes bacterium]|nr:hypothetical protein [Bacteroidota bacterium]